MQEEELHETDIEIEPEKKKPLGRTTECLICNHKFRIAEENKRQWVLDGLRCPSCGGLYCNKPETERILFGLQDKYLNEGRKEKYLVKILEILESYAKSRLLRHKSRPFMSVEDIDIKAHDAATYLIEKYLYKPKWRIDGSFSGYLDHAFKYVLYHHTQTPAGDISIHAISMSETDYDGDEYDFYSECRTSIDMEKQRSSDEIRDRVLDILFNTFDKVELPVLVALSLFMSKGESASDRFFQTNSSAKSYRPKFVHIVNRLRKELEELYAQTYGPGEHKNFEVHY